MSLEAFFKSLSMTTAVRDARIAGVTEICPANASFQVKYDPDVIKPDDLLREIKSIEKTAESRSPFIKTRIIEIPVLYQRPLDARDVDAVSRASPGPESDRYRIRGRDQRSRRRRRLHRQRIRGSPWFVSMVGFVAGLPFHLPDG